VLAASGRKVALVCSGDAGIYAMASLVCELLDASTEASWGRVRVEVVPGVSAMQLASGRAGAMLGHDFCAISLSDLLTPRDVIEQRLHAANAGDFVIALYNPISRQRVHTFERALEILRAGRAPDTVVIVARELGRPDEALLYTTLGDLRADHLDMLSIVLVGSSNSRAGHNGYRQLAYTPRGYRAPATIQRFEESNT
jgi:cobalt-precorrin 5A hydrolase/precorrin-3B C17-methyltransferase